ncbi:MAG: hypothetical protein IAE90_07440 [Ignavibacteria bacterium]|nr:hypothetical protein [Ignavibacteria bacterium]
MQNDKPNSKAEADANSKAEADAKAKAEAKTVVTHTIKFTVDTFITVQTDNTDPNEAKEKAVEKFREIIDPLKYARYDGNKIDIIK